MISILVATLALAVGLALLWLGTRPLPPAPDDATVAGIIEAMTLDEQREAARFVAFVGGLVLIVAAAVIGAPALADLLAV